MFRKSMLLMGGALALFVVYGAVTADDAKVDLKGIKCPVSGKAAKDVDGSSVAHNGGKVYFCCANCPKAFEKDTAKFSAKANLQLYATKQAKLVKCPLQGKDLNPATKIKVAGVDVCFCCNGCKGKVAKAKGDAQINLVFADKAFAKGFQVGKKE